LGIFPHMQLPFFAPSKKSIVRLLAASCVGLLVLGLASDASAQRYPGDAASRPQVVPDGMIQLKAEFGFNLSNGQAGKPINITPSVEYGVIKNLQVAVRHDTVVTGMGPQLGSLAFNVKGGDIYAGPSFEGKYEIQLGENMSIAPYAALAFNSFDPVFFQTRIGAGFWGKFHSMFALNANLQFGFALTNRSLVPVSKDVMQLNLRPTISITPEVAVIPITGFAADFAGFSKSARVPLGVAGMYTIAKQFDVGAEWIFPQLIADNGGLDARYFGIFGNFRFDTR
jgi:hypothetical protein